jgi:hypothetical protein
MPPRRGRASRRGAAAPRDAADAPPAEVVDLLGSDASSDGAAAAAAEEPAPEAPSAEAAAAGAQAAGAGADAPGGDVSSGGGGGGGSDDTGGGGADAAAAAAEEGAPCSICYEPLTDAPPHRAAALRCGHLFGESCIKRWLQGPSRRCPQCNAKAKPRWVGEGGGRRRRGHQRVRCTACAAGGLYPFRCMPTQPHAHPPVAPRAPLAPGT